MMRDKGKLLMVIGVCLLLWCPACYGSSFGLDQDMYGENYPGPRLFYPVTDDIDLKGEAYLEFKWERPNFTDVRNYDFRLYKGYNTTESGLILKKSVATDEYPIKIESSTFEANQTYTWVLVQVAFDGRKSDKSFSSFKITGK